MTSLRPSSPATRAGAAVLALVLFACQDSTTPSLPGPQFDVSEARFGDGNPDFFWAAPLAANPSASDPTFDAGAAHDVVVPYLRVCETDGTESADGCLVDVTAQVTGSDTGLAMTFDATTELYQVNWRTNLLDPSREYRIEIWGVSFQTAERAPALAVTFPDGPFAGRPRWLFGWRDIDDSPSTASCTGAEEFCFVNYGQNIPVKVRIEDYVFCPVDRNCAFQFVQSGTDANLEAVLPQGAGATSIQLFIPGQDGTDFPLGLEPCTEAEKAAVEAFSALPTFGPCIKTVPPPTSEEIELTEPVLLSYCLDIDEEALAAQLAVPESQLELLGVHHFSTQGDPTGDIKFVEAWPHAAPSCESPTSGGLASVEPSGSLTRLAQTGKQMLSWLGPQPLVALDKGGGGQGFTLRSFYMLALPTKFEYETAGDDHRVAPAGSDVALRAKATDLDGSPVWGAKPSWVHVSSPNNGASVPAPPFPPTTMDGISQATVTLSGAEGDNVFHAVGLGIADDRDVGCTLFGGADGVASCEGPREGFDPFTPNTTALAGGVVEIPEGTRLPFTVYGCVPGKGTPSIDGMLSSGEWDCARSTTFPVNLSGGSAVNATLFWMNDDTDLHFALRVPGTDRQNAFRIELDNDGDAPAGTPDGGAYVTSREAGDDVWEFVPGSGASDHFVDAKCSTSNQSTCSSADAGLGGGMQTTAAFDNQSGFSVYELSHPLSTGDTCTNADPKKGCGAALGAGIDVDAAQGSVIGGMFTLRLGSGAQGNTQFPGFLSYLKITIQ